MVGRDLPPTLVIHLWGGKSSFSIALICTTRRRIPTNSFTNQGPEKAIRSATVSEHGSSSGWERSSPDARNPPMSFRRPQSLSNCKTLFYVYLLSAKDLHGGVAEFENLPELSKERALHLRVVSRGLKNRFDPKQCLNMGHRVVGQNLPPPLVIHLWGGKSSSSMNLICTRGCRIFTSCITKQGPKTAI